MTAESRGQGADPYQVLGVPADATRQEIVRAYRQLARASHPDAQAADPAAAGLFREITGAYEVLADPARRARYDQAHPRPRSSAPARDVTPPGPPPPVGHPGPRSGDRTGGPHIWAGPVHVEPPPGRRAGTRGPAEPAARDWTVPGAGPPGRAAAGDLRLLLRWLWLRAASRGGTGGGWSDPGWADPGWADPGWADPDWADPDWEGWP